MKTYSPKGIVYNREYCIGADDEFCVQEMITPNIEKYTYSGDKIKYELDDELVILYDSLRNHFFKDIEQYYFELTTMPIFVQSAGQDSDCGISAGQFAELIQENKYNQLSNFYRHLYLVNCQFLIGSIQNLLSGMDDAFVNYYVRISELGNDVLPMKPDTIMFNLSPKVSSVSSLLESYFIKAYSVLDMFCKLAYELESPMTDFSKYQKMRSADKL